MATPTDTRTPIDVWVDPACPFAWMTSQWLFEVEAQRPIDVRFHVMSLSVLNQDKPDLSDFYRDLLGRAWGSVRVMLAAEQKDPSRVRALYVSLASAIHNEKRTADRTLWEDALTAAGYPTDLADAADTDENDEALRASHHAGMDPVGYEVGTPVIHMSIDGKSRAFFGPVVAPAPQGETAARLWDGFVLMLGVDTFFELKRTRDNPPSFHPVEPAWLGLP